VASARGGLDTIAGDRGYRFSGGEKQRLVLARLLLKAPSVVVLDEATAHLDSESEVAIQRAMATALAGRRRPCRAPATTSVTPVTQHRQRPRQAERSSVYRGNSGFRGNFWLL
jgi:ABC-type multidrug transport system fused ATPase/permease subunit